MKKITFHRIKNPYSKKEENEYLDMDQMDSPSSVMNKINYLGMDILLRYFKLYMMHTNFGITKPMLRVIEGTEGVETVDILTRYRIRIGIGKLFRSAEVTNKIRKNIDRIINADKTYKVNRDKKLDQIISSYNN